MLVFLQHGAVIAVIECISSDTAAWRHQLESRAGQQHSTQQHKPQTWEELQQLLLRWVLQLSLTLSRSLAVHTCGPCIE